MTSEVALLNRSAVALAADSAATATVWIRGEPHVRYFKGANKIFNISTTNPVGMMIYNAANLQGVPWEVLAKAFRDQRGGHAHDGLDGYATDFFDFLISDGHLFPRDHQNQYAVSRIGDAFLRICHVVLPKNADGEIVPEPDKNDIKKRFKSFGDAVRSDQFIGDVEKQFISEREKEFADAVKEDVKDEELYSALSGALKFDEIYRLAVLILFKKRFTTLQDTGVVFAGYGDKEYFPSMRHFVCYGVIAGKLICDELESEASQISHSNVSDIKPIAQSEMVKTFMYGMSVSALREIEKYFVKGLDGLVDDLVKSKAVDNKIDMEPHKEKVRGAFTDDVSTYLASTHTEPLRNVVGMLSVDELAELAETLISIESLKERVTKPTESVSGAIDVAVISKSDGFIWIKRKHYFEPSLNPRYFARKGIATGAPNG